MNPLLFQAAQLGVSAGTGFGPLHTLLMNTTLARGWRTGLLIVLTPLITDIPIIVLMLLILRAMPPAAIPLLNIIGAGAVFYIAYSNYRSLRNPLPAAAAPQTETRDTILKAMMVNFLNPGPYIYWGTISGPLFVEAMNESVALGASFMLVFYGVFLGLMTGFVFLFDRLRTLDPRLTLGLRYFSLVILTFLGIQLLLRGIEGLRA